MELHFTDEVEYNGRPVSVSANLGDNEFEFAVYAKYTDDSTTIDYETIYSTEQQKRLYDGMLAVQSSTKQAI